MVKPPSEEDELDELPPIDGEVGDAGDDDLAGADEDLDDEPGGDGPDALDDSTGEGDPVDSDDIDADESESGWLEDAGEAEGLDVGSPDTFGSEEDSPSLLEGAEEADTGEEDLTLGGGEEASFVGDAGEEGFEDESEDLSEAELPRLDSDEEDAELDDAELQDHLPDDGMVEEDRPPWEDRAWERVEGGPQVAAVDAIAVIADGILVGGQGLARVTRAGEVTALEGLGLRGGAARIVLAEEGWILVSTPRAGLLVSNDGGRSFADANGWRAVAARADADGTLDVVRAGAEVWGRTRSGGLLFSGDRGETWAAVMPEHRFEALAADERDGLVVALARGPEGGSATLARGKEGRLELTSAAPLPPGAVTGLAAFGTSVAVGLRGRGVFRSESEAPAWARLEGTASATTMAFVRGDGTLAIALVSEGEGKGWLVEARAGGPARTVAELGEASGGDGDGARGGEFDDEGDDVHVRALAWDGAAGVVWAGGSGGLTAFRAPKLIRPRSA